MSDSVHTSSAIKDVGKIAICRGSAEAAGFGVFFGSTFFTETLLPHQMNWLKDYVANHFVKHRIGTGDAIANHLRAVEGVERTAIRNKMTPEEKARYYANYIIDYGLKGSLSFAAQLVTQDKILPMLGYDKPTLKQNAFTVVADLIPKIGTFYVFNAVTPEKIDHIQQSISKVLQRSTGMSKERADTYAVDTMNVVVPNAVGLASAIGFLYWTMVANNKSHAK